MILFIFFIYFTFMVIFSPFGPLGGPLGALAFSQGLPRAPTSSLTFIATHIPGLVQPPVQMGEFGHFGVCQNNRAKIKAVERSHTSKNEKVSKCFCLIACLKRDERTKSI